MCRDICIRSKEACFKEGGWGISKHCTCLKEACFMEGGRGCIDTLRLHKEACFMEGKELRMILLSITRPPISQHRNRRQAKTPRL